MIDDPVDLPEIPQALIDHLWRVYPPIRDSQFMELRHIDRRCGQIAVVEYLEKLKKKQTNGYSERPRDS